ncbi:MAG: DUF4203 domain-containing protein [Anaerolineae bacterium]|nr:DUF4203 domain-containing protein [Candidatus Roseilinea sp.]MDW8449893.1 DUF4203 domain-containing protein [Anaerolineae bacterium]
MLGNLFSALVLGIIGLALLVFGYRWFRILLPFWAFFVGFSAVTAIVSGIFGQNFFSTAIACIPGVILGLIFALLSYLWWAFVVLFWAASVGFALGAGLISALGVNAWLIVTFFGIAGAIVMAILASRAELKKYLPIFLTASAGATMLLSAILVLFGRPVEELGWGSVYGPLSSGGSSILAIVVWIVLAAAGIAIQSGMNNRSLAVDTAQFERAQI